MRRASLEPRPKLFEMRTRELTDEFPAHVAANWLGHSNTIAGKHYRQTITSQARPEIRSTQRQNCGEPVRTQRKGKKVIHGNFNAPRGLPIFRVGDTGPATPPKSPGNMPSQLNGAAESAALDADLAIINAAWPLLAAHSRSIIVGMSRKAVAKVAKGEP